MYIFSIHLQTPGDHSVVLRRYENSCLFNYQRKCLERLRFGFHFCSLRDQGISYFANKLLSTHYNIIDTYSSIGFDCKGLLLWSHYHGFHRSSGVEKDPACRALYLHFFHIELFLFGRRILLACKTSGIGWLAFFFIVSFIMVVDGALGTLVHPSGARTEAPINSQLYTVRFRSFYESNRTLEAGSVTTEATPSLNQLPLTRRIWRAQAALSTYLF